MPVSCEADCVKLQKDLDRLTEYCGRNLLDLNVKKCQVITFTRKLESVSFNYLLDGVVIPRVSTVRDLGIMLDSKILFTAHYDCITQRARKMLGFIYRTTKPFKNPNSMKILFFAYVRSLLEYASTIWSPAYVTHQNQIESVQRQFIRQLNYRTRRKEDYNTSLTYYRMHSLEDRRTIAEMKLLFDVVTARLDCPDLTARIGISACSTRTRRPRTFYTSFSRTNYARNSTINRIVQTYELKFNDVDIFCLTRNKFIILILKKFPIFKNI